MKTNSKKLIVVFLLFMLTVLCAFFSILCFKTNLDLSESETNDIISSSDFGIKHTDSLEFIYMDKSAVNVGDSEKVYVSFYNQDYAKNSYLSYHKEDMPEQVIKPSCVNEEVALYEIPFNDIEDIGKYNFDKISWNTEDRGFQEIDKSDKGYSFSVLPSVELVNNNDLLHDIYDTSNVNIEKFDSSTNSTSSLLFSKEASSLKFKNGITICLDPGHGGSESGASYGGLREKDLNLKIAQACKEELMGYTGVNVVMTRDGDDTVELKTRADIASNFGSDLFVSFHNNAGGGTGSEVWVQYGGCTWHNEFNNIGSDIAYFILDKLCNKMGLKNRGILSEYLPGRYYPDGSLGDKFAVLYWTRYYGIPGILTEHAFIDGDNSFLQNEANLIEMGKYDAEAIAEYYHLEKYGPSDILSGTYKINTSMSNNKILDVAGKSLENEARLNVSDDDDSNSQRWKVETVDNNWVTIQNVNSGKYLDVYGLSVFDKAKVQQYDYNGGDNQKWKIIRVGDHYKILSKLGMKYALDLPAGVLDPSNYLEMYTDNGGINQLFDFTIDIPASDPEIEDGYYSFSLLKMDSQVMKVVNSSLINGEKIELNSKNDNYPDQIFKVEKVDNKYHKIVNVVTDKALDVEGYKTSISNRLEQWEYNGGINQLWSIKKQSDGSYCLYSACNGLVIDCYAGLTKSGTPICTYNYNGDLNQKWILNKTYDPFVKINDLAKEHCNDIKDGIYEIGSYINSQYVLDVYAASCSDCANVQLYKNNGGNNQQWHVMHDENGFVYFVNDNSKKCLDLSFGNKQNNSNVAQYQNNGGRNQKWVVVKLNDNKYQIISAMIYNDLLTVASNKPTNEANIISGYPRNNDTQFFTFKKLSVDVDPSDASFQNGYYKISNNVDTSLCADLEASSVLDNSKFVLWNETSTGMNQEFQITRNGNYHVIKSIVSDKYLTISSNNFLVQQQYFGDLSQCWSIQNNNGNYYIVNAKNGLAIDVVSQKVARGSYLCGSIKSQANSQKWIFSAKSDPFASVAQLAKDNAGTISDGLYAITLASANYLSIDVYGAQKGAGWNVQLYQYHSAANQKWFVINDEATGYVMFKNENSGNYLDISFGLKQMMSNVAQYTLGDGLNQKWIIIKDGDSYKIHSALLWNYYLVAQSYPASNETNISATYGASVEQQNFNFTEVEPTPMGTYICYGARTTVQKMMNYFFSTGHSYPTWYRDHGYGGNTLEEFCNIIFQEAIYEDVDPCVVFCQAMKETGWLTFTGDVNIDQCNFCGLGATGGGNPGYSFNTWGSDSVRMGIRAHVQHLKRYAVGFLNRPGEPVDPRFDLPEPGCAPTVEQLGGHWAPSPTYGIEIVNMMANCY